MNKTQRKCSICGGTLIKTRDWKTSFLYECKKCTYSIVTGEKI